MNENEKRILTVLNQTHSATRKEIASACGISWAATVKLVARLEGKGLIRCLGESEAKTENGKTSLVYAVAETRPLAIGIDVEYSTTRAAVYNLRRETFHTESVPTETVADLSAFIAFLAPIVERCKAVLVERGLKVEGVGIGMPGWLIPSGKSPFDQVARALSSECGLPVVADNSTRAYTLFLQRKLGIGGSFATFIVRTGVGVGIAIKGELYRGEDGLAGELGHLTVDPEGSACRCGKRGCMETCFNQKILASRWSKESGEETRTGIAGLADGEGEIALLQDLFSRAIEGNGAALAVLSDASRFLAVPVSTLSLAMDIRRIIVAGHFGPDASPLMRLLEERLAKELHPRFRHTVSYERLEDEGFLIGASMLFLSAYCDYSVLAKATAGVAERGRN